MPTLPPNHERLNSLNPYRGHPAFFINLVFFEEYIKNLLKLGPAPPSANKLLSSTRREEGNGNLIVCHDMAGGYVDDAHTRMWTMSWWAWTDTFIYFSHHRLSPPPREWINAGHRQGCKVLGTLIFESNPNDPAATVGSRDAEQDTIRLLMGFGYPSSETLTFSDSAKFTNEFADALVHLCELRGFDGYLLNFEIPLPGAVKHAEALRKWVEYLTLAAKRQLGEHRAQILWYDSVTMRGDLHWQNCLNDDNSPFLSASDAIFLNYFWRETNGSSTAPSASLKYLHEHSSISRPNSAIQVGIDVWGRGQYGGGGFGCYRALDIIDPRATGMSAAIFGPAWTYESFEPKDWEMWWDRERLLWTGAPENSRDALSQLWKPDITYALVHGHADVFKPFQTHFPIRAHALPFSTHFSLGMGTSFSVAGHRVQSLVWSDHELVAPLPDLAMPSSNAVFLHNGKQIKVHCSWVEEADKVWFGGHSICFTFPEAEELEGRLFVPLFSVVLGSEMPSRLEAVVVWLGKGVNKDEQAKVEPAVRVAGETTVLVKAYSTTCGEANFGSSWIRNTAALEANDGLGEFGVLVDFPSSKNGLIIGSASLRTRSPSQDTPLSIQFEFKGPLLFKRSSVTSGALIWERVTPLPLGYRPSEHFSSIITPIKPHTTAYGEEIIYEVTALYPNQKVVFWGTTSLERMVVSWDDDRVVQEMIQQRNALHFEVRAFDRCGELKGSLRIMEESVSKDWPEYLAGSDSEALEA